jgi:hypothetical protein
LFFLDSSNGKYVFLLYKKKQKHSQLTTLNFFDFFDCRDNLVILLFWEFLKDTYIFEQFFNDQWTMEKDWITLYSKASYFFFQRQFFFSFKGKKIYSLQQLIVFFVYRCIVFLLLISDNQTKKQFELQILFVVLISQVKVEVFMDFISC